MYSTDRSSISVGALHPVNNVSVLTVGTSKYKGGNLGNEAEEADGKLPSHLGPAQSC
jgi:hypothetical protein